MTRNGPPITTAQAQVTTAAVEIRTLTVSGKRMSIAVYDQMPWRRHQWIEAYMGSDLGYRVRSAPGAPWGWVNRHEKGCEYLRSRHLHLVSADVGLLFRSTVCHNPVGESGWPFWDVVFYKPGTTGVAAVPGQKDRYTEAWTPHDVVERLLREWVEAYDDLAALPQLYIAT